MPQYSYRYDYPSLRDFLEAWDGNPPDIDFIIQWPDGTTDGALLDDTLSIISPEPAMFDVPMVEFDGYADQMTWRIEDGQFDSIHQTGVFDFILALHWTIDPSTTTGGVIGNAITFTDYGHLIYRQTGMAWFMVFDNDVSDAALDTIANQIALVEGINIIRYRSDNINCYQSLNGGSETATAWRRPIVPNSNAATRLMRFGFNGAVPLNHSVMYLHLVDECLYNMEEVHGLAVHDSLGLKEPGWVTTTNVKRLREARTDLKPCYSLRDGFSHVWAADGTSLQSLYRPTESGSSVSSFEVEVFVTGVTGQPLLCLWWDPTGANTSEILTANASGGQGVHFEDHYGNQVYTTTALPVGWHTIKLEQNFPWDIYVDGVLQTETTPGSHPQIDSSRFALGRDGENSYFIGLWTYLNIDGSVILARDGTVDTVRAVSTLQAAQIPVDASSPTKDTLGYDLQFIGGKIHNHAVTDTTQQDEEIVDGVFILGRGKDDIMIPYVSDQRYYLANWAGDDIEVIYDTNQWEVNSTSLSIAQAVVSDAPGPPQIIGTEQLSYNSWWLDTEGEFIGRDWNAWDQKLTGAYNQAEKVPQLGANSEDHVIEYVVWSQEIIPTVSWLKIVNLWSETAINGGATTHAVGDSDEVLYLDNGGIVVIAA